VLPALALAATLATRPACSTSCPPENVIVKVIEPSGRRFWIDFIGQGSAADSPVIDSVRTMIADGFTLRAGGGDCGWKANPCVVEGSPGQ
jgi:hypothetical protein